MGPTQRARRLGYRVTATQQQPLHLAVGLQPPMPWHAMWTRHSIRPCSKPTWGAPFARKSLTQHTIQRSLPQSQWSLQWSLQRSLPQSLQRSLPQSLPQSLQRSLQRSLPQSPPQSLLLTVCKRRPRPVVQAEAPSKHHMWANATRCMQVLAAAQRAHLKRPHGVYSARAA